jgi:hypothetical protein
MADDVNFGVLNAEQSVLQIELSSHGQVSCFDKLWNGEILLPDGALNSCFVDGPLLAMPGILVLIVGPFALYRLVRLSKRVKGFPWYHRAKLVSLLSGG